MTKDEILTDVEDLIKSLMDTGPMGQVYNDGFKDGAKYVLQKLQQTPCTAQLPSVDVLMQMIEKECAEHITTGGLRFYGTSWAQLSATLQKFGYVPKIPF